MRAAVDEWAAAQEAVAPRPALIVAEVPLLFETGIAEAFDYVMLITAPPDVRRRRLTAKLTDSEFERRLAQQMPEEREDRAQRLRLPQHRRAQGAQGVRGRRRWPTSSPAAAGDGPEGGAGRRP